MASPVTTWRLTTRSLDLTGGALMGVVNVTPDSFSDGGIDLNAESAIAHGLRMTADGAALIDVGGESTRPGSEPVPVTVELDRVVPVVRWLVEEGIVVSVDTSKPEVAEAALRSGAHVVNDVTACRADGMAQLVADAQCGVVLMHMKGTPLTMQFAPRYGDVVAEVESFLLDRAASVVGTGADPSRIVLDPGFGFGKTAEHNMTLLRSVPRLASHAFPLMLGTSRKRFLDSLDGDKTPLDRDSATAKTTSTGFIDGARVFRVHNVEASRRALAVAAATVAHQQWDEWSQDSNRGDSRG